MYRFLKSFTFLVSLLGLTGCFNNQDSVINGKNLENLNKPIDTANNNFNQTKLKTYPNGTSVALAYKIKATCDDCPEFLYALALTNREDFISNSLKGSVSLDEAGAVILSGNNHLKTYYGGVYANGEMIQGVDYTYMMQGEGYAAFNDNSIGMALYQIGDNDWSWHTIGPMLSGTPQGQFTYIDGNFVLYHPDLISGMEASSDVEVIANFVSKTGSLSAKTENAYMSTNNFVIDAATGLFSGGKAEIGLNGGKNTFESRINGAFSGLNATGVHGVVMSNASDGSGGMAATGVFYAQRGN